MINISEMTPVMGWNIVVVFRIYVVCTFRNAYFDCVFLDLHLLKKNCVCIITRFSTHLVSALLSTNVTFGS